jgi:hypothetical protein
VKEGRGEDYEEEADGKDLELDQYPYLTERIGVAYEGERNNCLEACRHRKRRMSWSVAGCLSSAFWNELSGWNDRI